MISIMCFPKEVVPIAITSASLPAKRRILTVCVKLFLEKGYKRTTVAEICLLYTSPSPRDTT